MEFVPKDKYHIASCLATGHSALYYTNYSNSWICLYYCLRYCAYPWHGHVEQIRHTEWARGKAMW